MTTKLRSAIYHAVGDRGIDEIARRYGFHSVQAWVNTMQSCAKLQNGGRLDKSDAAALRHAFPQVPVQLIVDRVNAANRQPTAYMRAKAFAEGAGFGTAVDDALEMAKDYATFDAAAEVADRRDATDRARHADTSKPLPPNQVTAHNRDADSRRAAIESLMGQHDDPGPRNLDEARARLIEQSREQVAAREGRHTREKLGLEKPASREVDIAEAFDAHQWQQDVDEVKSVTDVEESVMDAVAREAQR